MVVSKLVRLVTAKLLNYKLQIVSELPNYIQQFGSQTRGGTRE